MNNRFRYPRRGWGRRPASHVESLEVRQVPSALPLVADPTTTNAAYVEAVYQDVLGRQADPIELEWGTSLVDSGQPRDNFVIPVVDSAEANAQFLHSVYQQYLGREADVAGINFWLGQMQAGAGNEAVEAAFLSSEEFYARAGSTTDGWIQAAYQTVLGRAAEAEAVNWATSELNAGANRYEVAMVLVMSKEAETRAIDRELARFGMSVDPTIIAALSAEVSADEFTENEVATDFLSSPQYFELHTGVPETIVPVPNTLPTVQQVEANIATQAAGGNNNVVFLGDSITEQWQITGTSAWNQYFVPWGSLGAGVGGDTTENVLWRLEQGELNGVSPKLVVLMIGTNDIHDGDSVSDTVTGITSVVRTVENEFPDAKILLLGVLPGLNVAADSSFRQEIVQTNQMIASLADERRIWFLDLSSYFVNPDGSLNQSLFQVDDTHPSAEGYQVFAQAIAPWVQALL